MRDLEFSDVYKMSKILKKMGLKFDIDSEMTQTQAGAEIIVKVFENLYLAQTEVNDFLGDLVGISGEEFNKLPFIEAQKHINDFRNLSGIVDFFKSAGRLMK